MRELVGDFPCPIFKPKRQERSNAHVNELELDKIIMTALTMATTESDDEMDD